MYTAMVYPYRQQRHAEDVLYGEVRQKGGSGNMYNTDEPCLWAVDLV